MEAFAVVILLGVVGYFSLKHFTLRGKNAVRAYLYLNAIREHYSVEVANQMAGSHVDMSPQTVRGTRLYARVLYGGKQLPMIADAKR